MFDQDQSVLQGFESKIFRATDFGGAFFGVAATCRRGAPGRELKNLDKARLLKDRS
jgi:hypothetical protein